MELQTSQKKEQFTGDINALKEAAVLLIKIRRRQQEIRVSPYLSRNDQTLKRLEARADEWIKKNIE